MTTTSENNTTTDFAGSSEELEEIWKEFETAMSKLRKKQLEILAQFERKLAAEQIRRINNDKKVK